MPKKKTTGTTRKYAIRINKTKAGWVYYDILNPLGVTVTTGQRRGTKNEVLGYFESKALSRLAETGPPTRHIQLTKA